MTFSGVLVVMCLCLISSYVIYYLDKANAEKVNQRLLQIEIRHNRLIGQVQEIRDRMK